jgi:predicted aldo/keto reductase-like oxidoreductase
MAAKRVSVILGNGSFGTKSPQTLGDKEKIQQIFDEYKKHGWNHLDTSRSYVCQPLLHISLLTVVVQYFVENIK